MSGRLFQLYKDPQKSPQTMMYCYTHCFIRYSSRAPRNLSTASIPLEDKPRVCCWTLTFPATLESWGAATRERKLLDAIVDSCFVEEDCFGFWIIKFQYFMRLWVRMHQEGFGVLKVCVVPWATTVSQFVSGVVFWFHTGTLVRADCRRLSLWEKNTVVAGLPVPIKTEKPRNNG
jgi:hypothetical protein